MGGLSVNGALATTKEGEHASGVRLGLVWFLVRTERNMLQPFQFAAQEFATLIKVGRDSAFESRIGRTTHCALKDERDLCLLFFQKEVRHAFIQDVRGFCVTKNPLKLGPSRPLVFRSNSRTVRSGLIGATAKSFLTPKNQARVAVTNRDHEQVAANSPLLNVSGCRRPMTDEDTSFAVDVSGKSRPINFCRHVSPVPNFAGIITPVLEGVHHGPVTD